MKRSFYTTANGRLGRSAVTSSSKLASESIFSNTLRKHGSTVLTLVARHRPAQETQEHPHVAGRVRASDNRGILEPSSPTTIARARQTCPITRQRMQREWQFSEKRRFREEPAAVGKTGVALFEHEYDEMPPETKVEVLIEKAIKMLQTFYAWLKVRVGLPNRSERRIAFGLSRLRGC